MKLTPSSAAKLSARWVGRLARRRFQPNGFILTYHRVAAPRVDPWNIAVAPDNFAGQMQVLAEYADVVPLLDLPGRLQRGLRGRPAAAVTFDDGYHDNLVAAKPVLDGLDLPATVFVPTGWIGDSRPMWWDRLSHALLTPEVLPERLLLHAYGRDFSWAQSEMARSDAPGHRARAGIHRQVWSRLRELHNDDARHEVLDALASTLGTDERPVADARPMTLAELRVLAVDGQFSVGSHSVTHPTMPSLSSEAKRREVEDSARHLEEVLGSRPATFAYPYGDLDVECAALVKAAGYELACSTREDLLWPAYDPHLLPRITVGNWSAAEFRARLCWYWRP